MKHRWIGRCVSFHALCPKNQGKIQVTTVDVHPKIHTEHLRIMSTALPLCQAVCTFNVMTFIFLNVHSCFFICFSVEGSLTYYFIPMAHLWVLFILVFKFFVHQGKKMGFHLNTYAPICIQT